MTRMMLSGLAMALLGGVLVAAEGTSIRSMAPALAGQTSGLPALKPIPDPAFTQSSYQTTTTIPTPTPSTYIPGTSDPVMAAPIQVPAGMPIASSIELFQDVRYRGTRNIAPCAVPTIIQVPNPCIKDKCCKNCVNVQVCVPPCDPTCVKVTRDGNRVMYDFGKYEVVVRTVGNHVVVHYGD